MNDVIKKEVLPDHPSISSTTIYGWVGVAFLFGLLLIAMGTVTILRALNMFSVTDVNFQSPRWMAVIFGGFFVAAGLLTWGQGVFSLLDDQRKRRLAQQFPLEPWRRDYPWDPKGIKSDHLVKLKKEFVSASVFSIFMIPFHLIFLWKANMIEVWIIVGIFDIIIACFWGWVIYRWLTYIKYGVSFLEFYQFPFYLGDELQVSLKISRPVVGFKKLMATLRCVQEQYEVRGHETVAVPYKLYELTSEVTFPGGEFKQKQLRCDIRFQLPDDLKLTTHLSQRPAQYWMLELKAEVPGIDYQSYFLVPVYSRR